MNDFRNNEARRREKRRKKAVIKNWTILIETIVIIILCIALVLVGVKYSALKNAGAEPSAPYTSSTAGDMSSAPSSDDTSSAEWMKNELQQWYLKLVNPDNAVDNDFIRNVDLAKINEKFSSGAESSKYFDSRAVDALNNMCQAALDDNISLIAVSSYRTYSYQQTLYNNRVRRCINEGYDQEKAKQVAATIVALPGTSEHHMGLAVDFNSVEESFENTSAFKWLGENAESFGFILRYPKDKTDITKIIYEPWHYRYVGVEHAKAMNELGMCMEEYVAYLAAGGKIG